MNESERRRWFEQTYGRKQRDDHELQCAIFQSAWTADPKIRAKAQRVVAYTEAQGGDVLTFAKMHWGHYWGLSMPTSLDSVIDEMGISEDEAARLLTTISQATRGPEDHEA